MPTIALEKGLFGSPKRPAERKRVQGCLRHWPRQATLSVSTVIVATTGFSANPLHALSATACAIIHTGTARILRT